MVMMSGVMGFPLRMVADWEARRLGITEIEMEEEEAPTGQTQSKVHIPPMQTVSVIEEESENVEEVGEKFDRGSSESGEED